MRDNGSPPTQMRYWQVRVAISEQADHTWARAVLRTDPTRAHEAVGRAVRQPGHAVNHRVGDEVAVARALRELADRLLESAAAEVGETTGEHDVTIPAH